MKTIKKITINWAESSLVNEGETFDHLLKANQVLEKISKEREGKLGYSKVSYTVLFDDDQTYTGRFDVHGITQKQETSNGALCFLQSMRDFVSFKAGLRKPDWMTDEQYKNATIDKAEFADWVDRLGVIL